MIIQHYKSYSAALGRDMEYMTYGDRGRGVIVFPSQNGRFSDYQGFGMVDVLSPFIESGQIRLICIDSIDGETWSSEHGDEHSRIELHEKWFSHIVDEVIPAVRHSAEETFIATGCSMGGFHTANFFFRRPDIFDTMIALSGLYHAEYFFKNYQDPLTYDNSPMDFLRNMPADHPYMELYRSRRIIICVGQGDWEEDLLDSTRRLDTLMAEKEIPAWFDYWGFDVAHDWPWWRRQIVYFMEKVLK